MGRKLGRQDSKIRAKFNPAFFGGLANAALLGLHWFFCSMMWQSFDCCVARRGQESFTTLRALAMRVPVYFLIEAPFLPGKCRQGVPNSLYLRIGAAAVTGSTIVASKVGRIRNDALQVRKRHFPTPINAWLRAECGCVIDSMKPKHCPVMSETLEFLPALIWVGGLRLRT
jgi:hypothetical protein